MPLAFTIIASGFCIALLIVAIAYAYRIVVETRIKERILTKEEIKYEQKEISPEDDLKQRLDQIRSERFSLIKRTVPQAYSYKETIKTKDSV